MKTNANTTILVIGASGNFGAFVTPALVAAGFEVRALRRAQGRAVMVPGVEVVEGDVLDAGDVARAARGVDVIVHAFNTPYADWDPVMFQAAENVAAAAAATRALIVLPGNVYGLAPAAGRLAEDAARGTPSKKSALRNRLEDQLAEACTRGARLLIVRAGDYMGAGADNTWFREMTKKAVDGGALQDPGVADVVHDWAYLPDLAETTARLVARRDELAPVEVFNFTSYQITSRQLLHAVNAELDAPRAIRAMPWWLLRPLTPFVPLLRELFDVKYLWEETVLLDDTKLRRFLGEVPSTPLPRAVRDCLHLPAAVPAAA